ncbi:MAG: hypothetical protein N2444_04485 [Methylocystis sp.]|nr:hypothetical protein [Methylocystis sp.]
MRYVLAAFFICAFGMPAHALLGAGAEAVSLREAALITQVKKSGGAKSAKKNSVKDYGIHPLVGSGGY